MVIVLIVAISLLVTALLVYLFVVRPRTSRRLGVVAVPGEATIELPAGEIGVFYEDRFAWRYSERPKPWSGFSMLVSDEGGKRVDLGPPKDETVIKSGGKNVIPYGTLELPSAGRYTVKSQVDSDALEPRITFG
jgi:hypothetical protein